MGRGRITINGLSSPILQVGPSEASEAVVCLHGNPGCSEDWGYLLQSLGPSLRGVAVDLPGFGQADKPAGFDYTMEGYARHVGDLVEVLGLTRLHLVLHDFGAVALPWVAAHPEAIGSLVLVDTGMVVDYHWHYLARIWQRRGLGEAFMATTTRSGFRLLLRVGNPRGLPREFLDLMYDNLDRGTKRAVLALYRSTRDLNAVLDPYRSSLRTLKSPVLVVWGGHDPYVPVAQAGRQLETFAEARIEIMHDSGHWPFIDDPEGFRELVVPFLRASASGGAGRVHGDLQ